MWVRVRYDALGAANKCSEERKALSELTVITEQAIPIVDGLTKLSMVAASRLKLDKLKEPSSNRYQIPFLKMLTQFDRVKQRLGLIKE